MTSSRPIQTQFVRFCVVGASMLVADAGIVQTLVGGLGWNPYGARLVSYLIAATGGWWLNRRFTFGAGGDLAHREWAKYLAANVLGFAINYGTYAAMVLASDVVRAWPWIGVAAGSAAGLAVNFTANKWYVFRPTGR